MADVVEEIEEGPVTREADVDGACGDHDFRGDFDQAASPSAGLAFAERIVCAAAVVIAFAFIASQCFGGQFGLRMVRSQRFGLRWLSDVLPQTDQQIVGRRVQVKPKQIGQVAMIAQPIRTETAFEFLVSILALASFGIFVISRFG